MAEVVRVIYEAATADQPRARYHVGDTAALTYTLKKLLPESVWEGIMQSYFNKAIGQAAMQQPGSPAVAPLAKAVAAAAKQQASA